MVISVMFSSVHEIVRVLSLMNLKNSSVEDKLLAEKVRVRPALPETVRPVMVLLLVSNVWVVSAIAKVAENNISKVANILGRKVCKIPFFVLKKCVKLSIYSSNCLPDYHYVFV